MNLKKLLPYLVFCSFLLLTSTVIGYFLSQQHPELTNLTMSQLQDKFNPLKDARPAQIFIYIFVNNTVIDLGMILLFFLFGLSSVFVLMTNGLLIGIIIQSLLNEQSPLKIATLLTPHGLLEIPSFLIAAAVSLWLSVAFVRMIFKRTPLKPNLLMALKIFLYIIVPLNLIAAFIETYITPLIYSVAFPS